MTFKFSDIEVDSVNHGYKHGDTNLLSVTSLLKNVIPEFDKHGISLMMAERAGVTQAEILRQWEEKGARSRDKGTRLHQYVEDVMAGKVDPLLQRINDRLPEMEAFDNAWKMLKSEVDAKMIKQEFVVGDLEFGVAGRVDNLMSVLLAGQDTRLTSIFDWKTGKFDINNKYERLLPPFHKYDNCKLNVYSIQLSLYRLIMERNKQVQLSDGYLLHLRDDGTYQLHRAVDFRAELGEWLKNGIPATMQGDPAAEKRTGKIIKILDTTFDMKFVNSLSERSRRELSHSVRAITTLLNTSFEDEEASL